MSLGTWVSGTGTNLASYSWHRVAYGNNRIVAHTFNGLRTAVSTDRGATWSVYTINSNMLGEWQDIAYGNGIFVIAGGAAGEYNYGPFIKSTDGINWTKTGSGYPISNSIIYAGGKFITVAHSSVYTSADGTNWTITSIPTNVGTGWTDVAYGNSKYVAISYNYFDAFYTGNRVMTSTNGTTWTGVTAFGHRWARIIFGNGVFVALALNSSDSGIMRSTDGSTWTKVNGYDNRQFQGLSFGDGLFIASSINSTITSPDGLTWTTNSTNYFTGITYEDKRFIGVGNQLAKYANLSTQITTVLSNFSISTKTFGETFTITPPTTNSNVTFTYSSNNTSVATISGTTVTIVGIGTGSITASQAETTNYTSATITTTFTAGKATPTITAFNNIDKTFGQASFNLSPSSNSSGAFSYTSSNTAVATVSGSTITIVGGGTSTITATQAATTNYLQGTASATLTVNRLVPTITNFNDIIKTFGQASFNLVDPSSNSVGLFSYTSSNTTVATISGKTVTIVGGGTVTITVVQAATTNYESGTATCNLTVNQAFSTIGTFYSNNITKTFGDPSFNLTDPSSNSIGAFSYTSSNTSVATVSGKTVTIVGAGSTTITAIQEATTNYLSGTKTSTLIVNRIAPTMTNFNNIIKTIGDPSFNLVDPSSNSIGLFTYSSSNNSIATISGRTVTIIASGTCTLTATQQESGNYLSGTITCTLTVKKVETLITDFDDNIIKSYGEVITLNLVSNSDGILTYSSSNTSVATISGNIVTVVGVGFSTITIIQEETDNYLPKTVTFLLTTIKAEPLITGFDDIVKTFGDHPFNLVEPTSTSPVPFTYTCDNPFIATVSGTNVTIIKTGTCTISATQETNENYLSKTITYTLTINKASPMISPFNDMNKLYGDAPFNIPEPTSLSSGSFSYSSSNTSTATVSGNTVTILQTGIVAIIISQEETENYLSEMTYFVLSINKVNTILGNFDDIVKTYGDDDFIIKDPVSNRLGHFIYISSDNSVATIVENVVTIVGGGYTFIIAIQEENELYKPGITICYLKVNKINSVLNYIDIIAINDKYQLKIDTTSDGLFSYSASDSTAVTINTDNTISFLKPCTVSIIAKQEETSIYNSNEFSVIINYTGA
jgi:hypothetical protein